MGQEITDSRFTDDDFVRFRRRLDVETGLLRQWFLDGRFAHGEPVAGFELEAWLVDAHNRPAPVNEAYLAALDDPLVVPELARFNVELNGPPEPLRGAVLARLHASLEGTWQRCRQAAQSMGVGLVMIGILPTLEDIHLILRNMSRLRRYRALNEQVFRQRQGRALQLEIHGREQLHSGHRDVMLESAATSFQIHFQVPLAHAMRCYNSAHIVAAPLVAVAANSPYLFGRDLWDETRIPLFEQAVAVGGYADAAQGPTRRVTFGTGYARESLFEVFLENLEHYPVLLPMDFEDERPERLAHVRLHNGTIWRWNRPLIGFDEDGTPHLRIEHRVVPGGPSIVDEIANAAFFFGLLRALMDAEVAPELRLPFDQARDNFYWAARDGLDAHIVWLDGRRQRMQSLVLDRLLPLARRGLDLLHIEQADRDRYLEVIEGRVRNACNGAAWQRAFVARHGRDMAALTAAYRLRQDSGLPVHEWDI
ncbi:MAG: glutamate-cysteine ligase family protein [Gammaproteobacteria bacterium]